MTRNFNTIQNGITVRRPRSRTKRAPLTTHQRAQRRLAHANKQDSIDAAVNSWLSSTIALADELAQRFEKKPRYFLDLFFHGGARMVYKRKKANPWSAFLSLKAKEVNSGERTIIIKLFS
jgi:hypothetical protein